MTGRLRAALAPLLVAAAVATTAVGVAPAAAAQPGASLDDLRVTADDTVVLQWNAAALAAIRATAPAPPVAARALSIAHTAVYDAWAAYQRFADGTRFGDDLRRPPSERTDANEREAVSVAALRALSDVFPTRAADFEALHRALGYDPAVRSTDVTTPAGVGGTAAQAVIDARRDDGSNQLGGYADTTGYAPVNSPDVVVDPGRWQPLRLPSGAVQRYAVPHWGTVTPFALASGDQFRPGPPPAHGSPEHRAQLEDVLALSAGLDDRTRAVAEYWSDGPRSELPPGHWNAIAQWVSQRDGHDLDADVTLFFALNGALLDASITAWDAKRAYDEARPITSVRTLYAGQTITAWAGPGRGVQQIDGATWTPYFRPDVVTPPFPDHVSGHSTFSAAAATVLAAVTRSDAFGASATVRAGSSLVEPGAAPSQDVVLSWPTFSAAAREAGLSRRYSGIHDEAADDAGRLLGRRVGGRAMAAAQAHIWGITG